MFVKFGIDHRDRRLVGHGQGQDGVVSSEEIPLGMSNAHGPDHAALDGQWDPHPRLHTLQ